MYLINNCMACRSYNVEFKYAFLDRFVVSRATGVDTLSNRPIHAIVCQDCTWVGTDARLDDTEISRYYLDYRGKEYTETRIELNPYYAAVSKTFDTEEEIERRLVGLNYLIDRNPDLNNIKTLLDFGGNDGKYIPEFNSNVKKYVYDISDKPVQPGIEKLGLNSDLKFDFVMCCHVLEHESDPDRVLQQVLNFGHLDTTFYFEVPNFDCPPLPHGIFHEHLSIFNGYSIGQFFLRHRLRIVDSVQYSDYIGFLTSRQ